MVKIKTVPSSQGKYFRYRSVDELLRLPESEISPKKLSYDEMKSLLIWIRRNSHLLLVEIEMAERQSVETQLPQF